MGLAASQARFLAITSRKMNCEFQSMQIAQEKLSITRDLQTAAQNYQNALNATKLVWDCDTVDNDIYDLTYDLMMNPSAINEYDAYLVTDTQGKIVLSEKMWNAALAAGIINENGDPNPSAGLYTKEGRDAFLEQLGVQNVVDPNTINSIKALGDEGYTNSGIGGEIYDKTIANMMPTNTFINYMKTAKYEDDIKDSDNNVLHKKGDLIYGMDLSSIFTEEYGTKLLSQSSLGFGKNDKGSCLLSNRESGVNKSSYDNLTLGDIITGKYAITYKGDGTDDYNDFKKIVQDILDQMAKKLGYGADSKDAVGLNVTTQAQLALNQAYEFTRQLLNESSSSEKNSGNVKDIVNKSQEVNGIVKGNSDTYSISLSNLLDSFLTNFVIALEGFDCGLNIDSKSAKDSNYVSKYPSYYFQLKNDNAITDTDELNADFYNQLYNQICMNGACNDSMKREMVTDKNYLANALKNGQLFVSTLNTDGYFYQGIYTASAHIGEVTDDEAVAQAEVEYNVTKSKLNYKEETLEIQMKNLDTEISALTTEFDTVKSLISKSVEKVFTMFN